MLLIPLLLFVSNTLGDDPHVVLYFKPRGGCVSERVVREMRKNIEISQARLEQDNAVRAAKGASTEREVQETFGQAIGLILQQFSQTTLEATGCMREELEKDNPCVKIDYDVDKDQCRAIYTCSTQQIADGQRAVVPATPATARRQFKAAVQ